MMWQLEGYEAYVGESVGDKMIDGMEVCMCLYIVSEWSRSILWGIVSTFDEKKGQK